MDDRLVLATPDDLLALRTSVVRAADAIGLGRVDRTKLATAAIELGRNALVHGGGGTAHVQLCTGARQQQGVSVRIEDRGHGIVDVDAALRDGFTTGNGMGMGLGGSRRLVNEFEIDTAPGGGTRVTIVRWA